MEIPLEEQSDGPPPGPKPPGPKPPGPKPSGSEPPDPGPSGSEPSDLEPGLMSDSTNTDDSVYNMFSCEDFYDNKSYFDNFISYFNYFSEPDNNQNNTNIDNEDNNTNIIVKEVFVLLGYFILHFISEIFLILVNKYLTPLHYLITESIYNLIHIPCLMVTKDYYDKQLEAQNEIPENPYNMNNNGLSENQITRILKLIAVFFEVIGYLIYMEIIQLNFCGINRNVAKNIQKRAKIESEYSMNSISEDSLSNDLSDSSDD